MITHVLLGAGAGLVAALLFSVVTTGAGLGVFLLYLAPLPILIVALGWSHWLGLLALAIGGLAASFVIRSSAGTIFAVGVALPAWWLAYLSLLARPVAAGPAAAEAGADWYPPGALLLWIGVAAAAVTLASALAIGGFDYETYHGRQSRMVEAFLRLQAGVGRDGPLPNVAGIPGRTLVASLVAVAPVGLATLMTVIISANLWAAGRIVHASGRLARPWPRLPATRMPIAALGALAGGAALSQLPGFAGIAGMGLVGGMLMTFAIQGLAFVHDVSQGRSSRTATLIFTYLLTLLFAQALVPLLALVGMADTASSLRQRLIARTGRGPPGPSGPSPHR